MKKLSLFLFLIPLFAMHQITKEKQIENSRVKNAFEKKAKRLQEEIEEKKIDWSSFSIFIRAFKKEKALEVWISDGSKYQLLKTYPFCVLSGELGPKRKQGDYQVPEGFYKIDRFNPKSRFHLSLGINYPNEADKILNAAPRGGDIFIHGDCQSIGCIPITDDLIEELYVLALQAITNGQKEIDVHIFPFELTSFNLAENSKEKKENLTFWKNLKEGYEIFEQEKKLFQTNVNSDGTYLFK